MEKLVSVVIPVKNRKEELLRCLKSVTSQTYRNLEVFVVDDKSTENIKGVVNELNDNRVLYLRNNLEVSNANVCRNIGIEYANGYFLAYIDSDDEWLPTHIEERIKFLNENECHGCFGSAFVDDGSKKTLRLSRDFSKNESMTDYLIKGGKCQTSSFFFLTYFAKTIAWDNKLNRHQDYDYSINFAEKYKFIPCQIPTTIIHWKSGLIRTEDYNSKKYFIQKHKNKISPYLYKMYHYNVYMRIRNRGDLSDKLKNHYRSEALRYFDYITYSEFQSMSKKNGFIWKLFSRLHFSLQILINRIYYYG
jgi:glycosyltransferase involved in cell wall biosynthesis